METITLTLVITEFFKKILSKINIKVEGVLAWILSGLVAFFVCLYYHIDHFNLAEFIVIFIQTLLGANAGYITLNNLAKTAGGKN
ncbi:MAG TPA: hypothetical protein PK131_01035 [Candidatus Woesebacteria bacterium]|nr:hypothetical protein [Candidatus Woesebacteria bacterium]HRS22695.1 hypothetical protein [Candidatus Woesebacteria bacterium]